MVARSFTFKLALAASLASAAVCGCGGSGPSTPSDGGGTSLIPATGRASVTVSVKFLGTTTRAAGASSAASGTSGVPIGAHSVRVAITDPGSGTALAQPQIIAAPTTAVRLRPSAIHRSAPSPPSVPTVTFSNIRAGSAHLHVTAYNSIDATGPAVGSADIVTIDGAGTGPMTDFTVPAAGSIAVTPVVTSTAATIHVSEVAKNGTNLTTPLPVPAGQAIAANNGDVLTFVATLYDAASPTPAELVGSPLVWSSSNSIIATVTVQNQTDPSTGLDPSTATVNADSVNSGTATIEVRDPNSGLTFDFDVQVGAAAPR